MTKKMTQCNRLIEHFQAGNSLTALEADRWPFFITQFHTRMKELREMGFVFSEVWETNENTGTKYKRYRLAGQPESGT